jgi:hypothetical protein
MADATAQSAPAAPYRGPGRNAALLRLELATAATSLGKWAFQLTLGVYAYRHGGTTAVGLVIFAQALPATLAAPFLGLAADRRSRQRLLVTTNLARALTLAAAAGVVAAGGSPLAVYALAALFATISTANQPARSALVPVLARSAREVAATTSLLGTIDTASFLLGAGCGAIVLAATGAAPLLAGCAASYLIGAVLMAAVPRDERPPRRGDEHPVRAVAAGVQAILVEPGLRLSSAYSALLSVIEGLVAVLVIATAIELLGIGTAGIGYLNIARGAGGVVGGLLAWQLLGRLRIAPTLTIGSLVLGLPLIFVGVSASSAAGIVAWAGIGAGCVLVRASGVTLAQRLAGDRVLGRVLATLETSLVAMNGLGALAAPALVALTGLRGALIVTGAALPLLTLASRGRLARLQLPAPVGEREFALVRRCPVFAPLPLAVAETVAARLVPVAVAAGEDVVTQGDHGDRYYIIERGRVDVYEDGVFRRELGAGAGFGEIALLRDVARTATVRAAEPLELFALDREPFLLTVTGHADSHDAARELAALHAGAA